MSGLDEKRALLEHSLVIRKLRLSTSNVVERVADFPFIFESYHIVDVPKAVRVVDAAMQNDPTLHYLRDTSVSIFCQLYLLSEVHAQLMFPLGRESRLLAEALASRYGHWVYQFSSEGRSLDNR